MLPLAAGALIFREQLCSPATEREAFCRQVVILVRHRHERTRKPVEALMPSRTLITRVLSVACTSSHFTPCERSPGRGQTAGSCDRRGVDSGHATPLPPRRVERRGAGKTNQVWIHTARAWGGQMDGGQCPAAATAAATGTFVDACCVSCLDMCACSPSLRGAGLCSVVPLVR